MTYDQLFQYVNALVLPAWLLLIVAPRWKWTGRVVVGIVVTMLAILYAALIFQALDPADFRSFGTLDGLSSLFTNKLAVLVGWIHYLAFDLMAGWYIVTNAKGHGISQWLRVPCLLFTFMMGPVGLLMYFIIRIVHTRKYFDDQLT